MTQWNSPGDWNITNCTFYFEMPHVDPWQGGVPVGEYGFQGWRDSRIQPGDHPSIVYSSPWEQLSASQELLDGLVYEFGEFMAGRCSMDALLEQFNQSAEDMTIPMTYYFITYIWWCQPELEFETCVEAMGEMLTGRAMEALEQYVADVAG